MFNIYNPDTYSEVPEGFAVFNNDVYFRSLKDNHFLTVKEIVEHIQNNIIPNYKNPFLLDKQIHIYMEWLYNTCSTDSKENKEKRKLLDEKNKNELVKVQLRNLSSIARKNKFNPLDEKTFQYAKKDVITIINGIPIYENIYKNGIEKRNYLFEIDFVTKIYEMYEDLDESIPLKNLIKQEADYYVKVCTDYSPMKSEITIKGYNFTVAQKEMMKSLTDEDKVILTDVILEHFKNKHKRYELAQSIFYAKFSGGIDNMLFAELCFCKDIEKEQEIMEDYYSGFDTIESKKELNDVLNNEYLNLYPKLKKRIKDNLIELLGL